MNLKKILNYWMTILFIIIISVSFFSLQFNLREKNYVLAQDEDEWGVECGADVCDFSLCDWAGGQLESESYCGPYLDDLNTQYCWFWENLGQRICLASDRCYCQRRVECYPNCESRCSPNGCAPDGDGDGDGDEDEPGRCWLNATVGENLNVTFSFNVDSGDEYYDKYSLDFGDGSIECETPCSADELGYTRNHTYGSPGSYQARLALFDGGEEVIGCGDYFTVYESVDPGPEDECVRNLQCPNQAQVGAPFNISYEFLGVLPGPYDVYRLGGRMSGWGWWQTFNKEWCVIDEGLSAIWYLDDTRKLTCPDNSGNYTFAVQCRDDYWGSATCDDPDYYQTRETCQVQCVPSVTSHTLTVTKQGTGTGRVTSSPSGIYCGTDCTEDYNSGTTVTLTATAFTGDFAGWSQDCSGTGSCSVVMSQARNVIAIFSLTLTNILTVSKEGTGTGTVTSNPAGINCGSDCTENYSSGTTVSLTASASSGSSFAGWGGDCSGTGSCSVVMGQARNVSATFNTSGVPNQPPGPPTLEPPISQAETSPIVQEKTNLLSNLAANLLNFITFGIFKK